MSKPEQSLWPKDLDHWLVVLQAGLMLLVFLSPVVVGSQFSTGFRVAGLAFAVMGVILGIQSLRRLRSSLTSSGALKPDGALVTSGPYRFVRHPVYTAQILVAVGWSLALGGRLTALFTLALSTILIIKAHREERRLLVGFTEYREYQSTTRMFIPFIY